MYNLITSWFIMLIELLFHNVGRVVLAQIQVGVMLSFDMEVCHRRPVAGRLWRSAGSGPAGHGRVSATQ